MKWEYMAERIGVDEDTARVLEHLNEAGAEGWELVSAVQLLIEPWHHDHPDRMLAAPVLFVFRRQLEAGS